MTTRESSINREGERNLADPIIQRVIAHHRLTVIIVYLHLRHPQQRMIKIQQPQTRREAGTEKGADTRENILANIIDLLHDLKNAVVTEELDPKANTPSNLRRSAEVEIDLYLMIATATKTEIMQMMNWKNCEREDAYVSLGRWNVESIYLYHHQKAMLYQRWIIILEWRGDIMISLILG